MARQQAGVGIDEVSERGKLADPAGEELSEGDDDAEVRGEIQEPGLAVAHPFGPEERETPGERHLGDRRGMDSPTAAALPVGLAHHADHRVGALQEALQGGDREGRRPEEEESQGPPPQSLLGRARSSSSRRSAFLRFFT